MAEPGGTSEPLAVRRRVDLELVIAEHEDLEQAQAAQARKRAGETVELEFEVLKLGEGVQVRGERTSEALVADLDAGDADAAGVDEMQAVDGDDGWLMANSGGQGGVAASMAPVAVH